MLRRRTKSMILKMESKKQQDDKLNGFKCKRKKEVEEILDYWESLDLPKYKNRNFTNKGFKEAVTNVKKAIQGTLYESTTWTEENRIFTVEEIKEAINNHHKNLQPNYYPQDKKFLKSIKLHTFFIPYLTGKTKKIILPVFLQNIKFSPNMVIEPISKEHALYLIARVKKILSRDLKDSEILDCNTFINILGKIKVKPFKPGLYDSIEFALETGKNFYKHNFNTKNLTSNNFIKRYFPDYLKQMDKLDIIDLRKLEAK